MCLGSVLKHGVLKFGYRNTKVKFLILTLGKPEFTNLEIEIPNLSSRIMALMQTSMPISRESPEHEDGSEVPITSSKEAAQNAEVVRSNYGSF